MLHPLKHETRLEVHNAASRAPIHQVSNIFEYIANTIDF
jgi:hypothetical protein